MAMPICLRLLADCVRAAASRTFCTAGNRRPIRMAMMAITTNSSINVKPRRRVPRVRDMTALLNKSEMGETSKSCFATMIRSIQPLPAFASAALPALGLYLQVVSPFGFILLDLDLQRAPLPGVLTGNLRPCLFIHSRGQDDPILTQMRPRFPFGAERVRSIL